MVRSAIYQGATFTARQAAHQSLVPTLTGQQQADRRAWHLAAATIGPDEEVATALELSGERARRRGGPAAAALERAAGLTPQPEPRVAAGRRRRVPLGSWPHHSGAGAAGPGPATTHRSGPAGPHRPCPRPHRAGLRHPRHRLHAAGPRRQADPWIQRRPGHRDAGVGHLGGAGRQPAGPHRGGDRPGQLPPDGTRRRAGQAGR